MYYEIGHAWEPKIIGVKDGLSQVEIKPDSFATKAEYEQLFDFFDFQKFHQRENKIPDFTINILKAHLIKNAKVTDFMTFMPVLTGCQFIISDRVYKVMKDLNILGSYFYPVSIYSKDEKIDQNFYLFYCLFLDMHKFDFTKSIINSGSHATGYKTSHLKDMEDYQEFIKKNPLARFDKMVFNDQSVKEYDFISTKGHGDYISERFKGIIESEKLTGLNIWDNDKLHFE